MGFGNQKPQKPDISLLNLAFNMPTPQELRRREKSRSGLGSSCSTAAPTDAEMPSRGGTASFMDSMCEKTSASEGASSHRDGRGLAAHLGGHAPSTESAEKHRARPEAKSSEASREAAARRPRNSSARRDSSLAESPEKAPSHGKPAVKSTRDTWAGGRDSPPTPAKQPRRRLQKRPPKSPDTSASTKSRLSTSYPEITTAAAAFSAATANPLRAAPSGPHSQAPYLATAFPHTPERRGDAFTPWPSPVPASSRSTSCVADPFAFATCQTPVHPNGCSTTLGTPQAETRGQGRQFSVELQQIQHQIDQARTRLVKSPEDDCIQLELRMLQEQLNSTLNNATAQAKSATPVHQSEKSSRNKSRVGERDIEAPKTPVESFTGTNKVAAHGPNVGRDAVTSEQPTPPVRPLNFREESPGPSVWHHLCSACGDVRSSKFHQGHPLIPGQKPLLNYCGPCKRKKIERGHTTERHHFCFGCGVVRSKVFQRKHAAVKSPLLPNYCAKCRKEVWDTETIVDVSAVSSDAASHRGNDSEALPEQTRPMRHGSEDELRARNSFESEKDGLRQRRRARKTFDTASAEQLRIHSISRNVSPVANGHPSSYFGRLRGSAQRRTQQTFDTAEDVFSPMSADSEKTVYQSPFIEDAAGPEPASSIASDQEPASPAESEERVSPSSAASSGHKTGYRSCLKGASAVYLADPVSPHAPDSTDNGSRVLRDTPDAGSTGNKTVKFEAFVRIGHSHAPSRSSASSEAELGDAQVSDGAPPSPLLGNDDSPPFYPRARSASIFQQSDEGAHGDGRDFSTEPPYSGFDRGGLESADAGSSRFSRGAFARGSGFSRHAQESPAMHDGGRRLGTYPPFSDESAFYEGPDRDFSGTSSYDESPFDEGFPCDFSSTLGNVASRVRSRQDSPPSHSSRVAFSPDFTYPMDDVVAGVRGTGASRAPTSVPNAANPGSSGSHQGEYLREKRSYSTQSEHSKTGRGETPSSRSSPEAPYDAADEAGRRQPADGGRDEASSSSGNPYYRQGYFATLRERFNRMEQSRAGDERPCPEKQAVADDGVPEPIVEEPYSPASPAKQMKLIGI